MLQSIDVAGGDDSLSGLIDDPAAYATAYGHAFDHLEAVLAPYDPSIASDASNTVRVKKENAWTAKLDRQRLIRSVE